MGKSILAITALAVITLALAPLPIGSHTKIRL